jgi:hypothetical protein
MGGLRAFRPGMDRTIALDSRGGGSLYLLAASICFRLEGQPLSVRSIRVMPVAAGLQSWDIKAGVFVRMRVRVCACSRVHVCACV